LGVLGLGCAIVAWMAPWLVGLAFGAGYEQVVPVLYVFLATVPVSIAGMVLGYPWFAALGSPDTVNYTSVLAAALHVGLLTLLWWLDRLTAYNVALCVLATQTCMLLLRLVLGLALARASQRG